MGWALLDFPWHFTELSWQAAQGDSTGSVCVMDGSKETQRLAIQSYLAIVSVGAESPTLD